MRKITEQATTAFRNGYSFKKDNTEVTVTAKGSNMYLHGHLIAKTENGSLFLNHCGWDTNTTKDRLNGLLHPSARIYQKSFVWYWKNGKEFKDGWNKV